MTWQEKALLLPILKQFITSHKRALIEKVIQDRTRYLTLVLEDTFQSFNASAIIRTAEIFGLQDIHAIQQRNIFCPTMAVCKGARKWVDIYTHYSTADCLASLKEQDYTIIATVLHPDSVPIDQIPITNKMALIFGTELHGITDTALAYADKMAYIPMHGFTQSFNVSVSVALCLQTILTHVRTSPLNWQLSPQEQIEVQWEWLERILSIPVVQALVQTQAL